VSMLYLKRKDKKIMERMVRKGKTEQRMAFRVSIVLHLSQGLTQRQAALKVFTTTKTVRKWKNRYLTSGIKGLFDLPRQGAPPKFSIGQRNGKTAILPPALRGSLIYPDKAHPLNFL